MRMSAKPSQLRSEKIKSRSRALFLPLNATAFLHYRVAFKPRPKRHAKNKQDDHAGRRQYHANGADLPIGQRQHLFPTHRSEVSEACRSMPSPRKCRARTRSSGRTKLALRFPFRNSGTTAFGILIAS